MSIKDSHQHLLVAEVEEPVLKDLKDSHQYLMVEEEEKKCDDNDQKCKQLALAQHVFSDVNGNVLREAVLTQAIHVPVRG